jgi:hypothetical protein
MAAVKPEVNNTHSLGTTTHKWSAVHTVDLQTATLTTTGDVEVGGNLTVLGESVQIDVASLAVEDPLISMARSNAGDIVDIGFYGKYVSGGTTYFAGLYRDADDGKFKFFRDLTSEPGTTVGAGGINATIVCDIEGTIEGVAASATALETARTISVSGDATGSVSFDGTADVDIALTISNGSVENGMLVNSAISFTDGTNSESIALGQQIGFVGTLDKVDVAYDAESNTFTFSLPASITADLVGNASTATALETARTLSVSGDATGSANFDGSANADIAITIAAGAVENSMLANSSIGFSDGVNSGSKNLGEALTIAGTANEVEVAFADGAFSVGLPDSITADVVGNASTATALETTRTISVSGDATGSVSFDGTANVDIALTISASAVENSMLSSSYIGFSSGGAVDNINLGENVAIIGTENEVDVEYAAVNNTFTISLPATINADLNGNAATASTADKWDNARTITLAGDLGGSVSLDGTSNVTLTATIQAGEVENAMLQNSSTSFSDGTATQSIPLGQTLTVQGTASEVDVELAGSTFTVGLPNSVTVNQDLTVNGTINGTLSGNATSADTADKWDTPRTVSLSGDVAGSAAVDGSANVDIAITIQASAVENSMLLHSAITFGDGSSTEGIELGDSVSFVGTANEVDVAYDAASNTFTMGLPDTITADLSGNATSASSAAKWTTARTLSVSGDAAGSASIDGGANADIAITIAAGAVENSMLANNSITFGDGTTTESIALGQAVSFVGTANEVDVGYSAESNTFTVGLPDTISADVSGNASTASALGTARTIAVSGAVTGSGSFDGTADLTISTTLASGNLITVGDGSNSETLAVGGSLTFSGTANEVEVAYNNVSHILTVGLPSSIAVNAATATALETSRTLSVSGDAAGSVSFDGTANADIALTIAAGAVENSMLANSGVTFSDGSSSSAVSLGSTLTVQGTANEVDVGYADGTFTIGLPNTITADVNGNASTATALETSRTISVSGDATGSASFDGTANADIALTIAAGAVENSMLVNSGIAIAAGTNGTGGDAALNLGETLTINGTNNEVNVAVSNNAITIGLPDNVSVAGNLTVVENINCYDMTISGTLLSATAASTVRFGDTLLQLGATNVSATVDHGYYSQLEAGSFLGMCYDGSASEFMCFTTDTAPSSNTVNTAAGGFAYANLHVAGLTTSSIINGDLTLPNTTGSNGQVLTSNGAGATTWQTPVSSGGATLTELSGDTTISAGGESEYIAIFYSGSAGDYTVTLPAAGDVDAGYIVNVVHRGGIGANLSLAAAGSDTINPKDGGASSSGSLSVFSASSARVASNGVDKWYVI